MRSCPVRVFAFLCFLAVAMWVTPASAQEQDGNVFLIISLDDTFQTTFNDDGDYQDPGSDTIIVRIGTLTGGAPDPRQTRFAGTETPPTIPPPNGETFDLTTLAGNQATIFGSFEAETFDGVPEPHMVTPVPTDIDPLIQAAVFGSSAALATAASENPFMTTRDIAEIVHDKAVELAGEGGTDLSVDDVAEAIFDTGVELGATADTCEAEGEMFPHDPDETAPLFNFELSFDDEGTLGTFDFCLLVDVAVKEQSINLKQNGTVSVTVSSSDTFDADEIDEDTIEIGGVAPDKVNFAQNKATAHFSIQKLVDAGVLTSTSTELTLNAFLFDGSCIEGTGAISIVTKKK